MIEAIISLVLVTTLLLGSPGPAPLALAGTSATFGVKRGVPFLIGILSGLSIAILGATLGLAAVLSTHHYAKVTLQVIGGLYIFYVAVKIASAPILSAHGADKMNAPTFLDGFILNLINPKAYAAFLAIFSQFLLPLENNISAYILTAFICLLVAVFVDTLWLCLGGLIGPLVREPRKARLLRIFFAILMVAAVLWSFLQ